MSEVKVVPYGKSGFVDRYNETRYRVVDAKTGKVLDDAQGYGYRSAANAWAAWKYKTRDKSKDAEKAAKEQQIRTWMNKHKGFVDAMDQYAFEIWKGSWGPDDKFDAKFVQKMLDDEGITDLPFTAKDLYRVWADPARKKKKRR